MQCVLPIRTNGCSLYDKKDLVYAERKKITVFTTKVLLMQSDIYDLEFENMQYIWNHVLLTACILFRIEEFYDLMKPSKVMGNSTAL